MDLPGARLSMIHSWYLRMYNVQKYTNRKVPARREMITNWANIKRRSLGTLRFDLFLHALYFLARDIRLIIWYPSCKFQLEAYSLQLNLLFWKMLYDASRRSCKYFSGSHFLLKIIKASIKWVISSFRNEVASEFAHRTKLRVVCSINWHQKTFPKVSPESSIQR